MNYPRYPEYKPSGVEWLGEVPGHWEVKRLKYHATCNDDALPESTPLDYRIRYVDISSVSLEKGIEKVEEYDFDDAPSRARRRVRDGDTILSTVRTYLKAVSRIEKPDANLIVSTGFAVIRPGRAMDAHFLSYLLRSDGFVGEVVANSVGVSYPAINASQVMGFAGLIPSIEEQRAIATFLDRETARIDALIEKKRRFIELLQEKRAALISRAVTRGLDPNAPLKDSCVDRLGEIPVHWDVVPLRRIISGGTRNGLYKTKEQYCDDGVPIIQMGEAFAQPVVSKIAEGRVSLTECELNTWQIEQGDLLFARRSIVFEGSGKCSMVGSLPEPHVFESSIIRVRPDRSKVSPAFLFAFFQSKFSRDQMLAMTKQVTISGIDSQQLKAMDVVVPPKSEQQSIVEFLEVETTKLDELYARVNDAICKLSEYRAALIAAAVTGKIDVREA